MLKLYRPGWGAGEAEHEATITRAAHAANLPAPAVGAIVEVAGRIGLELERLDGPSMLATLFRRPWTVDRAARLMGRLHAEMHDRTGSALPSLRMRLEGRIRAARFPADVEAALLDRLAELPDSDRICHGDFHPDNILMTAERPAVIDWVDTSRGHPVADIARTLLLARIGAPAGRIARTLTDLFRSRFRVLYLREYMRLQPYPPELVEAWVPVVAAARWREGIQGEQQALEGLIRSGIRI